MKRILFTLLLCVLLTLTAACELSASFGSAKGDSKLAGTYEGPDFTFVFAKDGTMRMIYDSAVRMASYSAGKGTIEIIYGDGSAGTASKWDYTLSKDGLILYESGASTGTVLKKTAEGQKTARPKEYTEGSIKGIFKSSAELYSFSEAGGYKYSVFDRVVRGTYLVSGNTLTLMHDGVSERHTFELDGDLTLFDEAESSGTIYSDAAAQYESQENIYTDAMKSFEEADYEGAVRKFSACSGYFDSDELAIEAYYLLGRRLYDDGKYDDALPVFEALADYHYRDCPEWLAACRECIDRANEARRAEEDAAAAAEESAASEAGEEAVIIKTDYYSVTVPGRISGKYVVQQHSDSVGLYEMRSFNDGYGGRFFELVMYAVDDFSFVDVPNIEALLGMITTRSGEQFYLFLWRNTDVPWSPDGYDDYVLCYDCTDEIIASITPLYGAALTKPEDIRPENRQVVIVDTYEYNGGYSALLSLVEWKGNDWLLQIECVRAVIGSNGTTGNKREGDHCTPSGTFNILFCFSDQALDTGLRQKYIREGDVWVTDQASRYYNTIQSDSAGFKDWSKSENIYRQFANGRSVAGIFFDYNGDGESAGSAVPGAGAALFMDGIGSAGNLNTGYGDIKLSGEDMLQLLKLLDQSLKPVVVIRPAG